MALGTSSMHAGSGTWPAKLRSLALLLVIVCMSATERVAEAQTAARTPVIGYLQERAGPTEFDQAFLRGLHELGYVEGKNFAIEYRWAEGKPERLPTLAAELVRLRVDVIVTALFPATKAARDATSTIPIVMATSIDAVGEGLVASLARPGGNITGLSLFSRELIGKRLEVCQEAVPGLQRVGALFNEGNPANPPQVSDTKDAAARLGIQAVPLAVRFPAGIEPAFAEAVRERIGAVIVISDTTTITNRSQLGAAALKHRIPTIFANRAYLEGGGLMSYGPNLPDTYRRAASYVDRILKGARPADMPIEQPTKLELVRPSAPDQVTLVESAPRSQPIGAQICPVWRAIVRSCCRPGAAQNPDQFANDRQSIGRRWHSRSPRVTFSGEIGSLERARVFAAAASGAARMPRRQNVHSCSEMFIT